MPVTLTCRLRETRVLRFDDGRPVRAASGITAFADGWLVVSDDSIDAALWTRRGIRPLRLLPPVAGHEVFDDASGTKDLKPDLEAACRVGGAALLLGSGSLPNRMRGVLVEQGGRTRWADLSPLYARVADALGIALTHLNLEGACIVDGALRWYQRGNDHQAVPSASVAVDLAQLLAAFDGAASPDGVGVGASRRYELPGASGARLAVTDALALPDGRVLVSAAAEATENAVDDGPVSDAALVLLEGTDIRGVGRLPHGPDGPEKVEGLALSGLQGATAQLIAVVDADDATAPSRALRVALDLPPTGSGR